MSAWTQLYSLGSSIIKRPAVWLLGIIGTVAAGYVTGYITAAVKPVERYVSETACRYREKPIPNESQFTILVSPLAHDPDRLYTDKVQRAFFGEQGFLTVPICESLNFDFSTNSQSARDDMRQRATELINAKHADLLLFGDVSASDKAVLIYAVNEHGGCDYQPKPMKIKEGVLGSDFTAGEKEKLIEVSLEQIQSACLNQSSIDWPLFAKRMAKMKNFLNHFDFNQPKYLDPYIEAMRLLYSNGQGDVWFSKGEEFVKRIIDKEQGNSRSFSQIYVEYAILLDTRFGNTNDKNDLDAAFGAFDKAIGLDPNNYFAYSERGDSYWKKGDLDRAIADFNQAIGLDPKVVQAYINRSGAYYKKGEWDRRFRQGHKPRSEKCSPITTGAIPM